MLTRTGSGTREIDITQPERAADRTDRPPTSQPHHTGQPDRAGEPGTHVHDRTDIAIRLDGSPAPADAHESISAGTTVEVLCRFDDRWTTGFTVVDVADDGYRLRRRSDGSILPAWFPADQIRPAPPAA